MISSDFLEMVGREEYQDCDLLIFDFSKLGKKPDKKERKKDLKSIEHVYYYDKMHVIQIIEKTLCAKKLTVDGNSSLLSPCAKAYRKSVIKEYGIRFPPDIVIGEDKLFNIAFYRAMKQCAYIRKTAYFVGWRRDSAPIVSTGNLLGIIIVSKGACSGCSGNMVYLPCWRRHTTRMYFQL